MFPTDQLNNSVQQHLSDAVVIANGSSFKAIFENEYVEYQGFAGVKPVINCQSSDAVNVFCGQEIIVNDTQYIPRVAQPDGGGRITFILEVNDGS